MTDDKPDATPETGAAAEKAATAAHQPGEQLAATLEPGDAKPAHETAALVDVAKPADETPAAPALVDAVRPADAAPPDGAARSPELVPVPLIGPPELSRSPLIPTDWRVGLAVILVCAGIYVPVMGAYGMFDPWETHYTEVARQFMVRNDWLSTYWHNGRGPEGWSETNFWTKPVGSFWLSGLSLKLFGYSGNTTGEQIATGHIEWAVRLPFFLCALFGIFCAYLLCARLFSRRCGFIAAAVLATAPMYFQIGRQAMTDMPYVGLMSGGLALFALALFGQREELSRRSFKLARWTIDWPHAPSYYLFLLAFLGFMGLTLYAIMSQLLRVPLPFTVFGRPISAAIVMGIYIVLTVIFVWMSRKTRTKNEIYLYIFYMAVGYAGLAKGLVAALQPGLIILVYLIASREWRMLTEVALARGLIVAVCVFCPWYHGMLARHGVAFWNELFGTEQLRRLTIGEQAQAKGTFDYYIGQVAYGLFPWIAFLPGALLRAFGLRRSGERTGQERATVFLYAWLVGSLALFTLTITKYHHYILPALPPLAILIAIYLDDLIEKRLAGTWVVLLAGVGLVALAAIDLVKRPAQWVWMYTYLYEPVWAQGVPGGVPILIFTLVFGVALLALLVPKARRIALWACVAVGIAGGGYIQNWYQLGVAPNWSQKRAIASYYKLRKGPEEELVAWQFNWRGETWYSAAEVVVSKSLDNNAIIQYLNERKGRRFFFITERGRYPSLRSMLPTERGRQTVQIVDDTNIHYVLAAAYL